MKQAAGCKQEKNRNWQHENQIMRNQADDWQAFTFSANHGNDDNCELFARTGAIVPKVDPCAFFAELRPGTAFRVWDWTGHVRRDKKMAAKGHIATNTGTICSHLRGWTRGNAMRMDRFCLLENLLLR